MTTYRVTLIKDTRHPGLQHAGDLLEETVIPWLDEQGITLYGTFIGLFGLATNELYLVTNCTGEHPSPDSLLSENGLDIVSGIELVPTVRPEDHSPREKPGVYVFRWFDVHNRDVDEIARLSGEAWVTFEGGFDTEVQGLFAERTRDAERGKMLLVTWYKDLAVWQESRRPPPEAVENFRRRHELTIEAKPIATRLYPRT